MSKKRIDLIIAKHITRNKINSRLGQRKNEDVFKNKNQFEKQRLKLDNHENNKIINWKGRDLSFEHGSIILNVFEETPLSS